MEKAVKQKSGVHSGSVQLNSIKARRSVAVVPYCSRKLTEKTTAFESKMLKEKNIIKMSL